jgi:hypothetical protein
MKLFHLRAGDVAARAKQMLDDAPDQASHETFAAVARIYGRLDPQLPIQPSKVGCQSRSDFH